MDTALLTQTPLFKDLSENDIRMLLKNLGYREKTYNKEDLVLLAGDTIHEIGIVTAGSVRIENNDLWGNTSVLASISPGSVFAETYALLPDEPMMVDVIAQKKNTQVLFLNVAHLFQIDKGDLDIVRRRNTLIKNLLRISSQKNLHLSRRIFHSSSKTIRGRVLSYLSFISRKTRSNHFTIPFNRQQLADYLGVERSALSHELSKMQKDGILTTNRNEFTLNDDFKAIDDNF